MTRTLVVKLPCREPDGEVAKQLLSSLPFVVFEAQGHISDCGRAPPSAWPQVQETVLMVEAPDVLLVSAKLPPLRGGRLRQALPHAIEEQLLQEPQQCHIALDPAPGADGLRMLGVLDRAWLKSVLDVFAQLGHGRVRVVPVARCLPPGLSAMPSESGDGGDARGEPQDDTQCVLPNRRLVLFPGSDTLDDGLGFPRVTERQIELLRIDVEQPLLGAGWRIPSSMLPTTLAALTSSAKAHSTLIQHVVLPGDSGMDIAGHGPNGAPLASTTLAFTEIAQQALTCRFDLCQFEFSRGPWSGLGKLQKYRRLPLVLLTAALVLNLLGANLRWAWLHHQRDTLLQQQAELLRQTFPDASTEPDAPSQMARQLAAWRSRAGEPAPNGLLALCDALSQGLGPIPAQAMRQLDYRESQLTVSFRDGTSIDRGLTERLKRVGVQADPLAADAQGGADEAGGAVGGDAAADADASGDDAPGTAPLRWVLRSLS